MNHNTRTKGDYMRQVNLNLNAIKGIVSKLKPGEKQADKAVDKVVEQAVEKAVSKSLLKDETKLDTVEIRTKVEKEAKAAAETILKEEEKPLKEKKAKAAEVVSPKKDDKAANNTPKTVVLGALTTPKAEPVAADNSVTFSKTSKKEIAGNIVVNNTQGVSEVDPIPPAGNITAIEKGGEITTTAFDDLVAQWNDLNFDTTTYEDKLALMDQIIDAADSEAQALNTGNFEIYGKPEESDPNYNDWTAWKAAIDKANKWRCYRVIMRNNYQQQTYFELNQGLTSQNFNTVFSNNGHDNPNWAMEMLAGLQIDASREYRSADEHDFRTTNPIYHENGYTILGYEYDNEGFQYFGGQTVWEGHGHEPKYIRNDDPQQLFMYNEAMISMYKTKLLAAQIRLKDPQILNNPNQSMKKALQLNIREFCRLLDGMLEEQKRLAIELNLMTETESEWGTTQYSWIDDAHGLIPGLTPPQSTPATPPQFEPPENYEQLCINYKGNPDKNKLMELIEFINNELEDCQNKQERAYWRTELSRWQAILDSWGNTTTAGNSNRPPFGNGGGRGVEDNSLKFGDNTEIVTPTLGNSVKPSKEPPKNDDVLPELFAVPNKLAEEVFPEVVIKPDRGIPEEILEETKFEEVLPEVVMKPDRGIPEEILEETKFDKVLPKAAVQPDEVIPEEEPKITEQEQSSDLISQYTQQFLDLETKYNDEFSQDLTAVTPGTREYKLQLKRLTELLNHICKMLDENGYNDQAHADFWKNKFKVLIAQWPSSEKPFRPEHGFSRPDQM